MQDVDANQDGRVLADFWYRICPELRYFKSRDGLREAKRAFRNHRFYKRRVWALAAVVAVVCGGMSAVAIRWLVSIGLSMWLAMIINTVACAIFGSLASLFLWYRPYVRFLRHYLQGRGVAVCLKCGYNLRGLAEPRCPECGSAYNLRGLAEPRCPECGSAFDENLLTKNREYVP
jgi:hypothetical protein